VLFRSAGFMGGTNPCNPPQIPKHYLELVCSVYVCAGLSLALFHKSRTGEGQLVELNYLRLGIWSCQVFGTLCAKDSSKYDALILPPSQFGDSCPVSTFNSFQTRDGMWVQLLGVDIARHLGRTLKSLGIARPTYAKMLWVAATKVVPNKKVRSLIIRARPVFWVMNQNIRAGIASFTWAELQVRFRKYDVWHSPIRMPRQVISYKQAHDNGVFLNTTTLGSTSPSLLVTSPVRLSGLCPHVNTALAAPGEHNTLLL